MIVLLYQARTLSFPGTQSSPQFFQVTNVFFPKSMISDCSLKFPSPHKRAQMSSSADTQIIPLPGKVNGVNPPNQLLG